MSSLFTIAKGEFRRYFISPLAYVYLICFLLLNGSFALYFGGIFTSGNASLKPMFDFLPWLYLLFISGIAMRLWAEEFKSGTILQIMTLPVSVSDFVWGKFLAAWAFCSLGLALTFPFVITLNVLGAPDNGIIFSSYLGAFLLAGAMLAIAQTASALTKNQVIALVLAVILNLLFFLSGLEYVLGFFRGFAPDYIIDMIASFSFLTHMSDFSRGLFLFSSFVFLVALILMFNFFTILIINFKTSGTSSWLGSSSASNGILAAILVFGAFMGFCLFSGSVLARFQLDFTAEKLFSPSASTRQILQKLPSPVIAKVYYSPILGERDEQFRAQFDNLRRLLQTYQRLSDGNFAYHVYNPEPLSDIEDRAIASGLQGLPIPDINAAAYFGIVFVNENGQSRTLPFLPLARKNLLEQDLTENIYLLEHQRPVLGVLTSLPILGDSRDSIITQSWQIAEELKKYYTLKPINQPQDLQDIDLLLMAHPQKMSFELEKAVYDFSVHGGKILAFFDTATEALQLIRPQNELLKPSDYGSLPAKWGFRFYKDRVVADLDNASEITIETPDYSGTTQDLIQFYLNADSFFADLPETKGLKRMLLTSASVFMPLKDAQVYFVPLMQAGAQSELLPATAVTNSIHPAEILRRFKGDQNPKYLAAHIISQQPEKPFELIVVGDTDILYDSFWTTSAMIGNQSYNIPLLDNGSFVLNALDVLGGRDELLALRGKSKQLRPFTELEKQQKQVLRQTKIKEKDIFDQIDFIKNGLNEIWSKKEFEGRQNFTPDELSLLAKIKNQLEEKRRDLFALRTELNNNLRHTEIWVKFFNIYAIPAAILLVLLAFNFRCLGWHRPIALCFNRRLGLLGGVFVVCLLAGLGSVAFSAKDIVYSVEGRPLFADLSQKINDVMEIKLQTHSQELLFIKRDNRWVLKQQPDFLVNQNRIKSFLSALLQASIYEKKADRLENLPRFGLLPLDNKNSKTTFIELNSANGTPILSFEVGDYNLELGRGASGAYIRFPQQFQIWLAAIELIDLDMDYHNWCYARLWNLEFGRFKTIAGKADTNKLAALVSLFLNTPLSASAEKASGDPILELDFGGEDFERLELLFYKQEQKFLVQFKFKGVKNNPALEEFAAKMQNSLFVISTADMEKITHAAHSTTGQPA